MKEEKAMGMEALPPVIWQMYHKKSLHELDFFSMTGILDWSKQGDDDQVLEPLVSYLAKWPDEVIFVFEDKMAELLYRLDRPEVARRAYRSDRDFSGDDFLYVRCTALINGRAYYNKISDGREKLNQDMEFEAILYAPAKAWARKHHKDVSEYPHIPSPSYETGSNEECWREENLWTQYALPLGWRIAVPGDWRHEEGENGEDVFYPPDSELTVRITPFHAEKAGKPAPSKVMEEAFLQSLPPESAQSKIKGYALPGFRVKFFEATDPGEGRQVFHIHAGYYTKGELLSVGVYGGSREMCMEGLEILHTLQKKED
ncbi:MAG: DUF4240 domain-containing protein [Lachnospiraceae bacterium]|nr:DUF4240 domain-containing protein [Lachnospiraceae bacterium]